MSSTGEMIFLVCFLFPPFILQTIGLFSPYWILTSDCRSIGLLYSCCSGDNNDTCKNTKGVDELDARALGLEVFSFVMMFLAVFGTCVNTFSKKGYDDMGCCGYIGWCCLIMFPVAGLFSFIGCLLIAENYSTSELGWSLILCLTPVCLFLFVISTATICYSVKKAVKKCQEDHVTHVVPPARASGMDGGKRLTNKLHRLTYNRYRSNKVGAVAKAKVTARSDIHYSQQNKFSDGMVSCKDGRHDPSHGEIGNRVVVQQRPSSDILPTVTEVRVAPYGEVGGRVRAQKTELNDSRPCASSSTLVSHKGDGRVASHGRVRGKTGVKKRAYHDSEQHISSNEMVPYKDRERGAPDSKLEETAERRALAHYPKLQASSSGIVPNEGNRNVPTGGGILHMYGSRIAEEEIYAHHSENEHIFYVMKKYTTERFIHMFEDK
ncbi:uncharacterized protein LOC132712705 [Ruditapes philippinarum]|uniref:uncharacterized protein LOC132712705 n=1 Tax=Ruditapes philippinarum TaxID=129788 RepID=UPI00295C21B8|nr:uncharacterized protein LOC132712705 [Ruditapes philippinarum]